MAEAAARAEDDLSALIESIRAILAEQGDLPAERLLAQRLNIKRHRLRSALQTMRDSKELPPTQSGRRPAERGAKEQQTLALITNPLEVIEMRMMLEPQLARLAALRASPSEIARIVGAADTPPGEDYGAADIAFHRAVAAGSRNGLAIELYQILRSVGADARVRLKLAVRQCSERLRQRDAEHRAIAEAIAERDPAAAEQAMKAHLAVVQEKVARAAMPASTAA